MQRAGEHSTLRGAGAVQGGGGEEDRRGGGSRSRELRETGALRVRSQLLLILHCPVALKDLPGLLHHHSGFLA